MLTAKKGKSMKNTVGRAGRVRYVRGMEFNFS